jgi:SAM-dependent methyltransferase
VEKVKEYYRNINEGINVEEAPSCLFCGKEGVFLYKDLRDRLFSAPGVWSLMKCTDCHFVWLNPRPVPSDIGKLYEEYFTHESIKSLPQLSSFRRMTRDAVLAAHMGYSDLINNPLKQKLGKILSWIGPIKKKVEMSVLTLHGQKGGNLLEVGCGTGIILAKMRELGWKVFGVEPDKKAVETARNHFGLTVHKGTLEEAQFPNDSMDAIVMHHVFEHFFDPIGTLKECFRILKPLGRLVIVTPNIESLGHRWFGHACFHLDPPRHLHLFSPHSLLTCAEKGKLRVLALKTISRTGREVWVNSQLIRRKGTLPGGSPGKKNLWMNFEGLLIQTIEQVLCKVIDVGEEIVLIATK